MTAGEWKRTQRIVGINTISKDGIDSLYQQKLEIPIDYFAPMHVHIITRNDQRMHYKFQGVEQFFRRRW
jgi:hypothetical protein